MRLVGLLLLASCSGAASTTLLEPATGSIEVRVSSVVQEPLAEHLFVTVDRVRARFECCGFIDVAFPLAPIDLLSRQPITLSTTKLPASPMTALEVYVSTTGGSFAIGRDGSRRELAIDQPSVLSTSLRLRPCASGHMTITFSSSSYVVVEVGDNWKLKPALELPEVVLDAPPRDQGACTGMTSP